ncbi:AAA family ATPase [Persicitalea sp.]|uniref:AAA family ATPase n=1 Tax=Persicitalea sp. TaxID=3100273 RepID=UPI003593950A
MIKSIEITNFYSFDSCVVQLHPETSILIGINGSGKSNFLKAVKLLKEGVAGVGLRKHILDNLGGIDNFLFKGNSKDSNAQTSTIRYTFEGPSISKEGNGFNFTDDIIYEINVVKSSSLSNFYVEENIRNSKGFIYLTFENGKGYLNERVKENSSKTSLIKYDGFDSQELALKEINDPDRYYALTALKKAIRDIVVYDYFDTTPKSAIRKPVLPTSEKRLASDGANLPQMLNTIKINNKPYYRKITDMLNEVNSNFTGFDFNFIGGNIELMIEENKLDSAVHVSNISDGTLRYLCLLSILYNPDRGRFICIDEPEVGLHPDMISSIADAVKEASESSTIVISTHSESLLNYFEIENVLVFEKDEGNATVVNTYTKEVFEGWYEDFALGHMWKQGDLGGVRYGS